MQALNLKYTIQKPQHGKLVITGGVFGDMPTLCVATENVSVAVFNMRESHLRSPG